MRIKNWPGDVSSSLVATAWERDMEPDCWLPAELSVVGEADLDVNTAVAVVVTPESVQAANGPLLE